MSHVANHAMPETDTELAPLRHLLAEAAASAQAAHLDDGAVGAHYQLAGQFDDRALEAHVGEMIASLSPMPARLARSAQAVFIELFQNICRYGFAEGDEAMPSGHISIRRIDSPPQTTLYIAAVNLVSADNIRQLQPVLDEFYISGQDGIRQRYLSQLVSPRPSAADKSSAGLGLLDIARRSSTPLAISISAENRPELSSSQKPSSVEPSSTRIFSLSCSIKEMQSMELFHRQATSRSPELYFDPAGGILKITGESYPENITAFFADIEQLIDQHIASKPAHLKAIFQPAYFNSGSARAILDLVQQLDRGAQAGIDISVQWLCDEDDDISHEFAEDIAKMASHLSFSVSDIANG